MSRGGQRGRWADARGSGTARVSRGGLRAQARATPTRDPGRAHEPHTPPGPSFLCFPGPAILPPNTKSRSRGRRADCGELRAGFSQVPAARGNWAGLAGPWAVARGVGEERDPAPPAVPCLLHRRDPGPQPPLARLLALCLSSSSAASCRAHPGIPLQHPPGPKEQPAALGHWAGHCEGLGLGPNTLHVSGDALVLPLAQCLLSVRTLSRSSHLPP